MTKENERWLITYYLPNRGSSSDIRPCEMTTIHEGSVESFIKTYWDSKINVAITYVYSLKNPSDSQ